MSAENGILSAVSSTSQTGLHLSLFTPGPLVQVGLAATVSVLVLTATAATFTIVVTRSQFTAPPVQPDYYSTNKITTKLFPVLDNERDTERNAQLTITKVDTPLYGTATISKDGQTIEYTSPLYYAGIFTFNYTAANEKMEASTSVTVTVLNKPPQGVDQVYPILKNSKDNVASIFGPISSKKCYDTDDDKMKIVSIDTPTKYGVASISLDLQNILYTPKRDSLDTEVLSFTISDYNDTTTAKVTFTVTNSPPIANPDLFTVRHTTVNTLDILANDYDANNDDLKIVKATSTKFGRVVISDDQKSVKYVPEVRGPYVDSFQYTISDGSLTASSYAIVKLVNEKPKASDTEISVAKNSKDNEVPLWYDDTDAHTTLTVTITKQPTKGTLTLTRTENNIRKVMYPFDSSLTDLSVEYSTYTYNAKFSPELGSTYSDTVEFQVDDNNGGTASGKVIIHVANLPPVANPDSITVEKNVRFTGIDVLSNDSDPNGDAVELVSTTQSEKLGSTLIELQKVTYIPPTNFIGTDTFKYTIRDIQNDPNAVKSAEGLVTVTVVNTPPVANDDSYTVGKGRQTVLNVLVNDYDKNGDKLSITQVGNSALSSTIKIVTVAENGVTAYKLEYTAQDQLSSNPDKFTYTISDGTATATASVTILLKNDPPTANDDSTTVVWRNSATVSVVDNDTDLNNGDTAKLTVSKITSNPGFGTATFSAKTITYTPNSNFVGVDSLKYKAKDEHDESNEAVLTITVTNRAPIAANDAYSQLWGTTRTYDVLSNDKDDDGDSLSLKSVTTTGLKGTAVIESGKIKYVGGTFKGVETFTYTITDANKDSTATVTVTNTNTAPVAAADSYTLHWKSAASTFSVLDNDSDADLNPLTITSVATTGTKGTVTINGGRTISYTPPTTPTVGSDSFAYTISDSIDTSTATVTITLTNVNTPTAPNRSATFHWKTTGTTFTGVAADKDQDGDTLSITISGNPTSGTASVVGRDINYSQNAGFVGVDSIQYTVSDGQTSAQGTLTVTITNARPTAQATTATSVWNKATTGLSVDISSSNLVADPDTADTLTISQITPTSNANGNSVLLNGRVTFTPAQGFVGSQVVTYTVTDGNLSAQNTITFVITNNKPVGTTKTFTVHWKTQTAGSLFDVLTNISDGDNDSVTLTGVTLTANGAISLVDQGSKKLIKFTQTNNWVGTTTFTVTFTDGWESSSQVFTVVVYNNAPTATTATSTVHWRSNVLIDVLSTASDSDSQDTVTLKSTQTFSAAGTGVISNGKVLYTPKQPFFGIETFEFTATDGLVDVTKVVTVTVTNTLPNAVTDNVVVHWAVAKTGQTLNAMDNDSDANLDTISVTGISQPSVGSSQLVSGSLGQLKYTLTSPSFTGASQSTSFTYTLSDVAQSSTGNVNVQITNNDRPSATDKTYTIHWSRSTFRIDLYTTAKDTDGDSITLSVQQIGVSPLVGTAVVKLDTTSGLSYVEFSRATGFKGTEQFNYVLSDGLASATAKVTINVINAIPTAVDFNRVVGTSVTTGLFIDVLSSAADADAQDTVTLKSITQPTTGTGASSIDATTNRIKFVHPTGYEGAAQFTYTVTDGLDQVTKTIYVTVTNKDKSYTLHWSTQTGGSSLFVMQNIVGIGGAQLELTTTQDGTAPSRGSFVVQTVGGKRTHVLYTQNANYLGEDTFQLKYTAADGVSVVPFNIFITIYDTKPVGTPKTVSTHWRTSVLIDCVSGATDADVQDTVSLSNTLAQPSSGSVAIETGKVRFTPNTITPLVGTVSFAFTVTDQLMTDTQTGTVTLTNNPPTTTPKSFSIHWKLHQAGSVINVKGTDSDANGDTLTVKSISALSKTTAGTATLNPDQTVTVKAAISGPLFINDATQFTYQISDGAQTVSESVIVTITNNKPITVDDVSNIKWSDSNVQIDVLVNDSDPNGDTLTLQTVSSSQGATVTIVGNKVVYTPPTKYIGTDVVTYTVSDGAESSTAKLTVNVGNTAPVGKDYTVSSHWKTIGTSFQFNVVADTTDVEGNTITLKGTSSLPVASQGTVTSSSGVITFVPTKGFVGTVLFQYTVTDSIYDSTKTISCTVTNTAPTATFPSVKVLWSKINGGQLLDVISKLSDANNDSPLTLVNEGLSPSQGTAVIETVSGVQKIRYTPTKPGYLGTDSFTIFFEDGWTKSSATFPIEIYNTLPTAIDTTSSVHWRSTTGITVNTVTGSNDVDGDTVNLDSVFGTYSGAATKSVNSITYVPSQTTVVLGPQVVQYKLTDGIQTINQKLTVTITNTLPVVSSITTLSHWKVLLNTGLTIDLLNGATDANGDTLTVQSVTNPNVGTATLNVDKRNVLFKITSASDRNKVSTFNFVVFDGAQTVTNSVTISITNQVPIAVNDVVNVIATNPQTKQLINILANDKDNDAADTISLIGTPTYAGTGVVAYESGKLAYTAPNGFLGTETVTYKITDGADEVTATATITVSSTLPVANADSASIQWNAQATINVLSNDLGTSISFDKIKTNPASGTVTVTNGVVTYTPNPSVTYTTVNSGVHSLVDTFTYTIKDIYGQTADGTVSVTVSNTAPVAVNDAFSFAKSVANAFQTFNVLINDQVQVGETITVSVSTPSRGTAQWISGSVKYQPTSGYSGTDTFTYTISDSQLSSTATVTVTITNSPPTGNDVQKTIAKGTNQLVDILTEGSFTDPNGDSLTLTIKSFNNAISTAVIEGNKIRYTALNGRSPDQTLGTNVVFTVSDGTASIDRTLNVKSPNNNPTAASVTKSFDKNSGTLTYDLSTSISDSDIGDVAKIVSFSDPNNCLGTTPKAGTITLSNNVFTYVQTQSYVGSCTINYVVSDQDIDNPKTATAQLTLTSSEKPIVAADDSATFTQNVVGVVKWSDLLTNDSYDTLETSTLTIEIDTTSSRVKGTNDNTNKQISYSPGDTCQNDYFNYRIKYASGTTSNWAKVTISIICQTCSNKVDLVFLVDGSGSITGANWINLRTFLGNLIDTFTIGDDNVKIGIVQFASSQTRVETELSNSKTSIKNLLSTLSQIGSNTPTLIGVNAAYSMLNGTNGRTGVPKVLAILTDGLANAPCNCGNCLCDHQQSCGTDFNNLIPCSTYKCNGIAATAKWCKLTTCTSYRNGQCRQSTVTDAWAAGASANCVGGWGSYNGYNYCIGTISQSFCTATYTQENDLSCTGNWLKFCYSCTNPHIRTQEINAYQGYKVVAMGVGSELTDDQERGLNTVRKMNYNAAKTIAVNWNDLNTVKNELLSQVCNTN